MQRTNLLAWRMIVVALLLTPLSPSRTVSAQEIVWKPIQGGLLYTRVETEDLVPGETSTVHVYSIDTSRHRLRFFDCREASGGKPLSLAKWYEQTDAVLLFNVCSEVEPDVSSPYLRISGRTARSRVRERWKGLLVSDGAGKSRPSTRIVDLQISPVGPADLPYADIYQQPMLLDEKGEIRVLPRDYEATRVAVAEDRQRNLLVFLTEEPCRLWDLARWLKGGPFPLLRAMNLGRGNTAQALGRHPANRVHILVPGRGKLPLRESGRLLEDAAEKEALCCVMGVVALHE